MDLGILRFEDPSHLPLSAERRRLIRHRLHTPVYASFSAPSAGMVLDLSELLDLHEDGFAVQTNERLEVNQPVNVCLDLCQSKTYIHGTGHVVWSDGSGRGGIRLSAMPDQSRKLLKEWLFVNLLIACTNHTARTRQLARHTEAVPTDTPNQPAVSVRTPVPDLSIMLSAIEAVRRELRTANPGFEQSLQFITARALSLTNASGAALAFITNGEMICRARAGDSAPPLGARVDVRQGFSGECVRTAHVLACEDTENDPRVDRDACRVLGIGSIVAAPIVSDFRVVGLLEIFSAHPRALTSTHKRVLEGLVELVPKEEPSVPHLADQPILPVSTLPEGTVPPESIWEPEMEAREPLRGVSVRRFVLTLAVLGIVALGLGYVLAPTIEKYRARAANDRRPTVVAASTVRIPQDSGNGASLDALRQMAQSGNPEAQYELGARYHTGDGVTQNDGEAAQWFSQAAQHGQIVAQATLAGYYSDGIGVPKDLSKAYFWSIVARARGDEASKYRVAILTARLTRAQVTVIQQQAENWLLEHPPVSRPTQNIQQ